MISDIKPIIYIFLTFSTVHKLYKDEKKWNVTSSLIVSCIVSCSNHCPFSKHTYRTEWNLVNLLSINGWAVKFDINIPFIFCYASSPFPKIEGRCVEFQIFEGDPPSPPTYTLTLSSSAGFVVFYDFITGLDLSTNMLRLIVGLYNNAALYGEPTMLPMVQCSSTGGGGTTMNSYSFQYGGNMALLTAKQPVPRYVW